MIFIFCKDRLAKEKKEGKATSNKKKQKEERKEKPPENQIWSAIFSETAIGLNQAICIASMAFLGTGIKSENQLSARNA